MYFAKNEDSMGEVLRYLTLPCPYCIRLCTLCGYFRAEFKVRDDDIAGFVSYVTPYAASLFLEQYHSSFGYLCAATTHIEPFGTGVVLKVHEIMRPNRAISL
jgi:hypothetical protein